MLLQLSPMIMALGLLGLGHTMPEPKMRIARDTRNIPTNMFKPIGQSNKVEQNLTDTPQDGYGETFQQRSTGEAHAVMGESSDESANNYHVPVTSLHQTGQGDYPQNLPTELREIVDNIRRGASNPSGNGGFYQPTTRVFGPFPSPNSGFYTQTYGRSDAFGNPSGNRGFNIGPIPNPNGGVFYTTYSGGPGNSGSFVSSGNPINSGSMPLMSRPYGFTGGSGPRGDSSNNFHRSESFSYTSDGSGPPQIEQHVYDSRQGFGSTLRNF